MGFNEESKIELELDKSMIEYDAGCPGQMSLSILGKKLLTTQQVSFGAIDESVGYHKKFRKHDFLYADGYAVDTETVIPMGAEPKIARTMDVVGNHIKVVTDILTRGGFPAEKMSVDSIDFYGDWNRFGFISVPEKSTELPAIQWTEIGNDDVVLYDSKEPFLVILLESVDGHVIEIGTGDDIWRWNVAEVHEETTSRFCIEQKNGAITLSRDVMLFDEERPMDTQTWRFKWYIAWEMKAERNDKLKAPTDAVELDIKNVKAAAADEYMPTFAIPSTGWRPEMLAVMNGDDEGCSCMQAKAVRNFYRNWLRPTQKRYQETKIMLSGVEPHICDSGAHVNRKEKGAVIHWDIINIFDFWLWANKQTAKNDGAFVIMPAVDSVAGELPSMRGLSR